MSLIITRATHYKASRLLPNESRFSTEGYVYGFFCANRIVKIGSSIHPGMRIGENGFGCLQLRTAVITAKCRDFRRREAALLAILAPWQLGHHRSERFILPYHIKAAVLKAFSAELTREALKELRRFVVP